MIRALASLIRGPQACAEGCIRDALALEPIDRRIRKAETPLRAANATLATLVRHHRSEDRQTKALAARHADLTPAGARGVAGRTRRSGPARRQGDCGDQERNAADFVEYGFDDRLSWDCPQRRRAARAARLLDE